VRDFKVGAWRTARRESIQGFGFAMNGSAGKWNNSLGGPLRGTASPHPSRFVSITENLSLTICMDATESGLDRVSPHRLYDAGAGASPHGEFKPWDFPGRFSEASLPMPMVGNDLGQMWRWMENFESRQIKPIQGARSGSTESRPTRRYDAGADPMGKVNQAMPMILLATFYRMVFERSIL
jgi:hypothetical protein